MRTELKEIEIGQKILLPDGSVGVVDDFDGSFYFLEKSDECFLKYEKVNVIID